MPGTLLALAPNPWDGPWMNRQQLLSRLAQRGWRVIYGTGPRSVWERGSPEWRAAPWLSRTSRRDGVLVHEAGRLLPRWPGRWPLDDVALAVHGRELARLAGAAGPDVLHLFHPSFAPLLRHLPHAPLVYHAYDVFTGGPRLEAAEAELLRRADQVIASGPEMAAHLRARVERPVSVIANGVDYAAFATPAPEPEDLKAVPRPRIGYVGTINRKVDLPLVRAIAERRPDWHWVMVGAVREEALAAAGLAEALEALRRLPNVHLLGPRPHTALPGHAQGLDVATMCYATDRDGWWRSGYPLKLHEYLATGRPVVSAPLDSLRPFSAVLDLREGVEDWIAGIDHALSAGGVGTPASRRAVARANTWDARVEALDGLLRGLVPGPPAYAP